MVTSQILIIIYFDFTIIYKKKLQIIYFMLYKRWCKTTKIQKYKQEHYVLA